jgi:hypothetical protein
VQRYFFTIRSRDRVEDDPDGTYLPDLAAALSYAECTIRNLRKEGNCNDPALMMVVQDQARQTVLFLPFFPGSKEYLPILILERNPQLFSAIVISLQSKGCASCSHAPGAHP